MWAPLERRKPHSGGSRSLPAQAERLALGSLGRDRQILNDCRNPNPLQIEPTFPPGGKFSVRRGCHTLGLFSQRMAHAERGGYEAVEEETGGHPYKATTKPKREAGPRGAKSRDDDRPSS